MPDVPFETLIDDLHGPDWTRRCDAARRLGQSKDPRAVDALLPDLQASDWRVRRNAAQALGALKSPRAVPGLLQALSDRTATVRERAAVALGRIREPQTLRALIQAVIEDKDSHFHVNEGAYQAVRKFGRKAGPFLIEAFRARPNIYLVQLLADSKYDVPVHFFISLAESEDPAMRRIAVTSLGTSHDPQAALYLIEVLAKEDPQSQLLAAQALANLGAVQAAPRMLDLLEASARGGPRADLNRAIIQAFQQLSGLKKDLEISFPTSAMPSFGVAGGTHSLPEMMGMLGEADIERLNQVLFEVERRAEEMKGTFDLPPEVFQAVADQTWRFGAMFADAREVRNEHVRLLMESLHSESSLRRAAAALSLPGYGAPQALAALERSLQDPDEMVRRAATWAHAMLKNRFPEQE